MCKHEVEHLIGTKDGIKCRLCGKQFKTFAELEADRQGEEKPEEVTEEKEVDEIITEEEKPEEKTDLEKQEKEIDETLKAVKEKKKAASKRGTKK